MSALLECIGVDHIRTYVMFNDHVLNMQLYKITKCDRAYENRAYLHVKKIGYFLNFNLAYISLKVLYVSQ